MIKDHLRLIQTGPGSEAAYWALREAAERLVDMARTTGGVAGRDEELCAACDAVEAMLGRRGND